MTYDFWGKEPPPDDDYEAPEPSEGERAAEYAAERARALARKVYDLKLTEDAKRQLVRERRAARPRPRFVSLTDFLAQPDNEPTYRIDQLWPTGGRVLMPAKAKAGKTSFVGNALRALADGTQFLDRFGVRRAGRIALIDDELDPRQHRRWLRAFEIETTDAVHILSLRGDVASFDILDDETRSEWAKDLAGSDVVIIDCLRPILDALGLDENHDVGRFLVALDTMLAEAGCSECLLIHHMGHGAERSRGDSRLVDWPDAIWKLVRDKDEENPDLDDLTGSRYFSAFGRDVEWPQSELTYDPDTRRLSIGESAPNRYATVQRRNAKKADEAVMQSVADRPGLTKRALREACRVLGATHNQDIDAAVERLVETGRIWRQKSGAAQLHWPGDEPAEESVPNVPNLFSDGLGTPRAPEPATVPFRAGSWAHQSGSGDFGHGAQPGDDTLGTPQPTKPCPDCGTTVPAYETRCAPCTHAFAQAWRAANA